MKIFLSQHLEPIAFALYLAVFSFTFLKINRKRYYFVLCGYYALATILMVRAEQLDENTHLYNMLYVITSLSLGYYFFCLLGTWQKFGAAGCALITLGYYLGNRLFFDKEILFDSIGSVISSLGIVLLIFIFFYQVMTNVNEEPLSHNFDFWFVCVQLFYHLGAFAIFLSYNYLTRKVLPVENYSDTNRTTLTYLWAVHNVLLFLSALAMALATLWIYRKKLQSSL